MIVDCDRCVVRGDACQDCVITVLLGAPPGGVELDGSEAQALENLAAGGMVPRLQLVTRDQGHNPHSHSDQRYPGCGERSVRWVG